MANISYFEQTSRNTISINIINSLRRSIKFNTPLEKNHIGLLNNLHNILSGNSKFEDSLGFYFRDSATITDSVPYEIYFSIKKVLQNENEIQYFTENTSNFLNKKSIKNKANYISHLESIMDSLDIDSKSLHQNSRFVINTKGF